MNPWKVLLTQSTSIWRWDGGMPPWCWLEFSGVHLAHLFDGTHSLSFSQVVSAWVFFSQPVWSQKGRQLSRCPFSRQFLNALRNCNNKLRTKIQFDINYSTLNWVILMISDILWWILVLNILKPHIFFVKSPSIVQISQKNYNLTNLQSSNNYFLNLMFTYLPSKDGDIIYTLSAVTHST